MIFPRIIELYPQTKLHVSNCPWQICSYLPALSQETVNVLVLVFSGI